MHSRFRHGRETPDAVDFDGQLLLARREQANLPTILV
jgi:hypothetical protein